MNLHFVGGFLGSGKTTAIIQAARTLMEQGCSVGVITNDQGKYLVDTAFFHLADIPAVEVTGGCFCCNYADLDSGLAQLIAERHPDVIFAESVGSCADVVATVVRPLLELAQTKVKPASFSVFADARLLRRRLRGEEMPFSDEIIYIFDKQIEESGLVVVNKVDLLSEAQGSEVLNLLASRFPGKLALPQTSLTTAGVQPWLDQIQAGDLRLPQTPLEIDYARYGAGEARLAWLDEEISLHFPSGQGRATLTALITRLAGSLANRGAGIGHLKFIIQEQDGDGLKISLPTLEEPGWGERIPDIQGTEARLLVNARVEIAAGELKDLLRQILAETGLPYSIQNETAFHPAQPNPTYRLNPPGMIS